MMKEQIKVIGFDADDTLWINEDNFRNAEDRFADLLGAYGSKERLKAALFETEMKNLNLLGYGVKPFMISMVETAVHVSSGKVAPEIIQAIIALGKEMLQKPIELLPGVKELIRYLHGKYKLIVATKGDLLDQERKLEGSSLSSYFHHIEIMSDKTTAHYEKLLAHLEIKPSEFVMIGNSLRSDILPPYALGSYAIHVPYRHTWVHEMNVEDIPTDDRYYKVDALSEVKKYFV